MSPQDKGELDRFCSALISIRKEIEQVRRTRRTYIGSATSYMLEVVVSNAVILSDVVGGCQVASGKIKVEDSPLRNAPHTMDVVLSPDWNRPYSRYDLPLLLHTPSFHLGPSLLLLTPAMLSHPI